MLSLIVAATTNGVIGNNNQLIWHIPSDLKYFKETTLFKTIVMGKNTHLSIGKALPFRTNHVISSTLEPTQNVEIFKSPSEWIVSNMDLIESRTKETFIIGGKQIYEQFLPTVEKIYYTVLDMELNPEECDTRIFTVYDLLNTNEWIIESVHKIYDENSYFKFDTNKKPISQTRYVLTRKTTEQEFRNFKYTDKNLWYLNPKFGCQNKHVFEYFEDEGLKYERYFNKEWRLNGALHREDGPALETLKFKSWFINGQFHRVGGPAKEYKDGHKEWRINGLLHREDGPAIECADGTISWWLNDNCRFHSRDFDFYLNNCIVVERGIPTDMKFGNLKITEAKLLTAQGTVLVPDNLPGRELFKGDE